MLPLFRLGGVRTFPTARFLLALGLLSGCATAARMASTAQHPHPEPDCSFRSATSCWTLGTRFPARSVEPADTEPGQILNSNPAVLASEADSTSIAQ
jgi:hypothetical protein